MLHQTHNFQKTGLLFVDYPNGYIKITQFCDLIKKCFLITVDYLSNLSIIFTDICKYVDTGTLADMKIGITSVLQSA